MANLPLELNLSQVASFTGPITLAFKSTGIAVPGASYLHIAVLVSVLLAILALRLADGARRFKAPASRQSPKGDRTATTHVPFALGTKIIDVKIDASVVTQTRIINIFYDRSMHEQIADLADPIAQQILKQLLKSKYRASGMRFSVQLHLADTSHKPPIVVEAITYDPWFDYDEMIKKAFESELSGYALYSEMPGDVAFRIDGQCYGMFRGGWIDSEFTQKFEKAYPGEVPRAPYRLQALTVAGWFVKGVIQR